MKRLLWLWPLLGACALLPPAPPPRVHHLQATLMHTQWDFQVPARSAADAERWVAQAAELVEALDQRLAMWRPESELSAFNASAGSGRSVTVSADLDACLRVMAQMHEASQGALDPTVGPLTQAWWQARQDGRLLGSAELKGLLARRDARALRRSQPWDPGAQPHQAAWSLDRQGMRVDLGAVAKGHAQDRVAALFTSLGLRAFLINAGGQVYARGRKPDGSPWRVGIEHPRHPDRVAAILELEDACLSTSGDYTQVTLIQGRRVHHILDPRDGHSVRGMASASALLRFKPGDIAPGAHSDAASTAAFVLGGAQGLAFLKDQGMEGLLISEEGQSLTALRSSGLQELNVVLNEP
jgi:FAD:protein FMN transferase